MSDFTPAPLKPTIDYKILESIDIRVGTIRAVEDVPASKKLVKMTVSFGDHTRSILAGLKQERADVAELVGRQTLFVVNLAPKKMAAETSEGMLLDVGYADGILPAMLVPEHSVPDGTRA
jgi:tRNA-binding protein